MFRPITLWTLIAAVTAAPVSSRGDRYELKSGGEVVGELIDRGNDGTYVVRTPTGAQVALERLQVVRIVPVDPPAAQYRERSRQMPDTLESHRELAEWCRTRQLNDERQHHLRRVLEFAPDDPDARLGLGYQLRGGEWVNRDELMRARGLELFEGKYRTRQEIAIRQRTKVVEEAENNWFAKLRLWRSWLDNRRQDRVDEARREIASIDDPMAAPSVVRLLADEKDTWIVRLYVAVLGRLNHSLAIQTLVDLSLHDADPDIREQCLDLLTRGERPVSIVPYVQALKSADNDVVNRAAFALAQIGDPEAVSPLIDALVTTHRYRVEGASPGQISAGMTNGGGGLSFGGNGPKIRDEDRKNSQVLRTLAKLSGRRDLEYDEQAWRSWFVAEQARQRIRSRRDD